MSNIFLHSHIGGDGSNFLIWLLSKHTDNSGLASIGWFFSKDKETVWK